MTFIKKHISTIGLFLVFFLGLGILLYPTISDLWNRDRQTRVIVNYESVLAGMTKEDYEPLLEAARDYNEKIKELKFPFMYHERLEGYESLLNVSGNGLMGYISIDKIDLKLPIYHGISEVVLNEAVGHVPGSSLPVGGKDTHCVLSAHRGLPRAKLFTDLDDLMEGDLFTVTTLNQTLIYKVDKISIVEPEEVDGLYVVDGKDYCTLVTCTPYGINTHRLLVRGVRVDESDLKKEIYVETQAKQVDPLLVTPVIAVPILVGLLIMLLVKYRNKKS